MNKIILASQSPRRKQLLEWAEVPFEIVVKETDERFPPGLEPDEVAVYIARNFADLFNDTLVYDDDTLCANMGARKQLEQ
ncbi:MAG: Maf family protein, partial [Chitinophagaceae bacterium]|nr:Maf family protein [Chitinophagaceae bacterium]